MKRMRRFAVVGVLSLLTMIGFAARPSMAQPRAHVYLLRGLMNIFSLGMDTLAEKIQRRGIYATIHNYAEWQTLADQAAAAYHAGKEGPIIIVGHSLGADAVMQMSAYLGRKGVPVALAVPFDARGSYATPSNVGRLLNLTHAGYGYMSRGAGFHGSLSNVDVSSDRNIDHLNIDKSARLHTQVLAAVLEVVGNGLEISVRHRQRTTAMLSARSPRRKRGRAGLSNRRIRRGRRPNPPIASPIRLNPYCRIECRVSDLSPSVAALHRASLRLTGAPSVQAAAGASSREVVLR
jgi:antitoxin (DNA-binding transcriptional repressor) of toxin-antitoxin stability system